MTNPDQSVIQYYQFTSELEQYFWITQKIQQLLAQGHSPGNLAVINRKHKELITLARLLQAANIPIFYEKGQDVLQKPFVQQLIILLKFIHSLNQKDTLEADHWLPTILSWPFWELDATDIWKLSIFAYQQPTLEGRLWFTWLLQADKVEVNHQKLAHPEKFQQIGEFLLNLANQAKYLPIEQLIDQIIDSHWPSWSDYDEEQTNTTKSRQTNFHTNFAQYYFHQHLNDPFLKGTIPIAAVDFLSNLRTLLQTIRQHRAKEVLYLPDFLEFIQLAEKNQIAIIDRSAYGSSNTGVNLLTTHKAKGLEFSVVFIPNCNQDYWFGKGRVDKLGLPDNIVLTKDQENEDDYLRLLFVAITRAKDQLYLTRYTTTEDGKTLEPIGYLETSLQALNIQPRQPLDSNNQITNSANLSAQGLLAWQQITGQPNNLTVSTKSWLSDLLVNYQLSVTHLNDFLDLEQGGPLTFVQKHLLKFPQSPSAQAAYGTAMHKSITFLLSQRSDTVTLEQLLKFFQDNLLEQRLHPEDYQHYAYLGSHNLTVFYHYRVNFKLTNYQLEYDFSNQSVQLGQAKLTGKIDYLALTGTTATVIDFKTGKPMSSWTGRTPQEQTKLWRYRNQLIFYKLLVENSRSFGSTTKVQTSSLQFLDAHHLSNPQPENLVLSAHIDEAEVSQLSKLIQIVYQKILTLDFPDISQYPPTFQGTQEFCQDLLS